MSTNLERWRKQYEKEMAERRRISKENAEKNAPVFRNMLLAAGATKLIAKYDGQGDSGCIENVCLYDKDRKVFEFEGGNFPNPKEIKDRIENLFYDLLENRHAGWEINDGSFGEFTWDLVEDTLSNIHRERYTSTRDSEHEGW